MENGIVVLGAVFVDIKGYPTATYIPAGRNEGRVEQVHGGVSRNVAENIANVELRPTFVSLVDDSALGQDVVKKLNNHKVNTKYIREKKDGMGTWLAVFDNEGDVVASISKRPDLSSLADILDEEGDDIFSKADAIAIEFDIEKETLKRVFKYAKKYEIPVFAVVSNMSIAVQRREYLKDTACFVCNLQEAGQLFSDDFSDKTTDEMREILAQKVKQSQVKSMIVTMGGAGAVYADLEGNSGICPAKKVDVIDTTGAGDAFFSGVALGLTYGKTLAESCEIGTRLSASVITSSENVCPRFLPSEFGIEK